MIDCFEEADSVDKIDLDRLYINGKRFILIDLDNTIARWKTYVIKDEVKGWVDRALNKGFEICIISNNHNKQRTQAVAKLLNIKYADTTAKKPAPKSFQAAIDCINGCKEATVMVGDQLFSDVKGAYKSGIDSILVAPIYKKEAPITKLLRIIERLNGRKIKWQDK